MTSSYDQDMPKDESMAVDTQFMFTEGHIRLLIWMCDTQQDYLEAACDDIFKQGDCPSDTLMNCREGVAELKIWAHRLLDSLEEEEEYELDDEEEIDEDEELEDDSVYCGPDDIESLREALQIKWRVHRGSEGPERQNPIQKLRSWLRSLLN